MSSQTIEEICWQHIEDGDYRKAKACIQKGVKTDKELDAGISIIHFLSGREGVDSTNLLELCLKHGASPNAPSYEGITPVHIAAMWGLYANLCILLKYRGNPEVTDSDGLNALDYASQSSESQADLCVQHLKRLIIVDDSVMPQNDTAYTIETDGDDEEEEEEDKNDLCNKHLRRVIHDDSSMRSRNTTYTLDSSCNEDNTCGKLMQDDVSYEQENIERIYPSLQSYKNIVKTNQNDIQSCKTNKKDGNTYTKIKPNTNGKHAGLNNRNNDFPQSLHDKLFIPNDIGFSKRSENQQTGAKHYAKHTETQLRKTNHVIDGRDYMTDDDSSYGELSIPDDIRYSKHSKARHTEVRCTETLSRVNEHFVDGRDYMTEDESSIVSSSAASFYTACEGDLTLAGGLDDTVVTFPKLHPWMAGRHDGVLDDTVIDSMERLDMDTGNDSKFLEISNTNNDTLSNGTILYDWKEYSILETSNSNADNTIQIPESMLTMNCQQVKAELLVFGEDPGPVRADTRMLYIRRLARLKSGQQDCQPSDKLKEYLPEVRAIIEGRLPSPEMDPVEESMCVDFTKKTLRDKWREGTEKSSFNYLLLDPRVTQNLPLRSKKMAYEDIFHTFVAAVFYVGKGKRSRPYAHLYEAAYKSKDSRKLQQIRDIWSAGLGVVCLHCFQGVIPVEAYTREACMVEALGLTRLTNKKRGDYYGRAKSWSTKKKRQMGVYLTKRALQIFLHEGERQIRTEDLKAK